MPTKPAAKNIHRPRSSRLGLRAAPEQEKVLRRAADASHKSLTEFILDSACQAAEQTLLDQRLFLISDSQSQDLLELLDRPARRNAGVRALMTHPFDQDAERFYLRFGFEPSPIRETQLLLLLKDARKTLG